MNKATKNANRPDYYQAVTDQIIKLLEDGTKPWSRPWLRAGYNGLPMRHNGEFYRGVNVLLLDMAHMTRGFISGYWMTFKQAKELGGVVRQGEKGTTIFKAGTFRKKVEMENLETGETEKIEKQFNYLKAYTVFNVDQIDELPQQFYGVSAAAANQNPDTIQQGFERFFARQLSDLRHGGGRAFYSPAGDFIQMPLFEQFKSASSYYAVLAHEHVHWTKAEQRLNRNLGATGFGSVGYAKEELVAELGAAFLSRYLGFENHDREDHAAYIASWLKVLKNDKREIFRAAAHAQRAVDWMIDRAGDFNKPAVVSSDGLASAA